MFISVQDSSYSSLYLDNYSRNYHRKIDAARPGPVNESNGGQIIALRQLFEGGHHRNAIDRVVDEEPAGHGGYCYTQLQARRQLLAYLRQRRGKSDAQLDDIPENVTTYLKWVVSRSTDDRLEGGAVYEKEWLTPELR